MRLIHFWAKYVYSQAGALKSGGTDLTAGDPANNIASGLLYRGFGAVKQMDNGNVLAPCGSNQQAAAPVAQPPVEGCLSQRTREDSSLEEPVRGRFTRRWASDTY